MGEIADSLINGEFDYITGEYTGSPCGYPRSYEDDSTVIERSKKGSKSQSCNQFNCKARQSIFDIMKARNIHFSEYQKVIHKFLRSIPKYESGKIGNLNKRYKIIYISYRKQFKKFCDKIYADKIAEEIFNEHYN